MIKRFPLFLIAFLLSIALANASDSQTFQIIVTASESINIDIGNAPMTRQYFSDNDCNTNARHCNWYPWISYSTNYITNRKIVAKATTNGPLPILQVSLEKNQAHPDPFVPQWGSGTAPGSWAFNGDSLTLLPTDQNVVVGIQNGQYVIAPTIRLSFLTFPQQGTYEATLTVTIMAQ